MKWRPCRCTKSLFLCQRFLLFRYICIDAGYVRSIPWSKSSAKESLKVEWESGWSNWAMIRKFSTFDDVLLQRPSWPSFCVTWSLFTDPIFSLKEPLSSHTEWKTAGDLLTARACGRGRGWGQRRMFFLFLSRPPRSPIVEKVKKKRLCTDYLTWCIIHTKIIVSDPVSHKCPVKLLPKICDNSFILFTLRPSKIGKTFREFPQESLNSKTTFIFPV